MMTPIVKKKTENERAPGRDHKSAIYPLASLVLRIDVYIRTFAMNGLETPAMIPLMTSIVATTECAPKAEVANGVSARQASSTIPRIGGTYNSKWCYCPN